MYLTLGAVHNNKQDSCPCSPETNSPMGRAEDEVGHFSADDKSKDTQSDKG